MTKNESKSALMPVFSNPLMDDRLVPNGKTAGENFRSWFDGSCLKDESGNPLVVFHSTNTAFDAFDSEKTMDGSFWFTSNRLAATQADLGAAGSKHQMAVHLKVTKLAGWEEYERLNFDQIIALGFDGIQLDDDFVVFDPKQIKSANHNSGLFDPKSGSVSDGGLPPLAWTHRMIDACTAQEAGFHFEEGGCFAMACALREAFLPVDPMAFIAVNPVFRHAVVFAGGVAHDHQGHLSAEQATAYTEVVLPTEIEQQALQAGHDAESFAADLNWAKKIIRCAMEMAGEVNEDGYRSTQDEKQDKEPQPMNPSIQTNGVAVRSVIPLWVDHLSTACAIQGAKNAFANEGSFAFAKVMQEELGLIQPGIAIAATPEMSHAIAVVGTLGVGPGGVVNAEDMKAYTQSIDVQKVTSDSDIGSFMAQVQLAEEVIHLAKKLCIENRKTLDLPDLWLRNSTDIAHHVDKTTPGGVNLEFVEEMFNGAQAILVRIPTEEVEEDHMHANNHMQVQGREASYLLMEMSTAPPVLIDEDGTLQDGGHRLRTARKRGDATMLAYQMVSSDVDLKIPRLMVSHLKM